MNHQTNISPLNEDNSDDFSVLNYLLEHVKGIHPSSLMPELEVYDDDQLI